MAHAKQYSHVCKLREINGFNSPESKPIFFSSDKRGKTRVLRAIVGI